LLDPRSWLKAAQETDEGRKRRVDHDCGGGKTLIVSNGERGWSAFCFRCDDQGFKAKPQPSLAERIARRRAEQEQDERIASSVALPEPINTDVASWPGKAAVWLYSAGIGIPEIARLGAYWHEPSARVVLPVAEGDNLVYWQARDPWWTRKTERPKYINPDVNKQHLVASYGRGDPLVLTEDVLSAFRVGEFTEAWSLLGTNLTDQVLARIIRRGGPVRVWLDGDAAGRKASRRILKQLRSCGIDAERIETPMDPKKYSRRQLPSVIGLNASPCPEDA